MALQYSTAIRNNQLDQVESTIGVSAKLQIRTGSPPAKCAAANSGSLLIEISLPADWMNAAGSGSKTKNGTWSGTATGAGRGIGPTALGVRSRRAFFIHIKRLLSQAKSRKMTTGAR